jgi:hypothetical protein
MRTAGRILQDFTPAIRAGNRCLVGGIIAAVDVVIPVVVAIIIVVAVGCHREPPCFSLCRAQSTLRFPIGRPLAGHSPPAKRHDPMPTRFWLSILLAILAGIAVLLAKPTGRKQKSSVPWRGQIKPPPPPPIPQGPGRNP